MTDSEHYEYSQAQEPSKPSRILFLVPRRSFEFASNKRPEVAKQSKLLKSLLIDSRFDLRLDFHIESIRFIPKSRYGWHISVRTGLIRFSLMRFFRILRTIIGNAFSGRGQHASVNSVRRMLWGIWAEYSDDFWEHYLRRNSFDALCGVMLTTAELRAARKIGIPSFEIQHGILQADMISDYFPEVQPDYICVWPLDSSNISLPHNLTRVDVPFTWEPAIKSKNSLVSGTLVILGHNIERAEDPAGLLEANLGENIRNMKFENENLSFRFHPKTSRSEMREFLEWLAAEFPDATFHSYRDLDVSDALVGSRVSIMSKSTIWLDSISSLVPSIILDPKSYELAIQAFPRAEGTLIFNSVYDFQNSCLAEVNVLDDEIRAAFADQDFSEFFAKLLRTHDDREAS